MQHPRLSVLSILVAVSMFAACGGDDGDGGTIDAPIVIDAPPDAAPVTGLGKPCVAAMMNADCPANAPVCVGLAGAGGTYCSPLCVTNGTAKGAQGGGRLDMFMPALNDSLCAAAFSGTVGMPSCGAVLPNYMPLDNPPVAGTSYTNVNVACAILCGASMACPAGLNANTSLGGGVCLCVP